MKKDSRRRRRRRLLFFFIFTLLVVLSKRKIEVERIVFLCFRNDEEFRRSLEKEAERLSKYELAQVLRLEKKNKKREEYQR